MKKRGDFYISIIILTLSVGFIFRNKYVTLNFYDTYYMLSVLYLSLIVAFIFLIFFLFKILK